MAVKQKPAPTKITPAIIRNLKRIPGRNIFQKDIEALKREVKNYNERVRYQVNKVFKDIEGAEKYNAYQKFDILAKKQYIQPMIRVNFSEVKGPEDMDRLFNMLRADMDAGKRAKKDIETQMWMESMISRSLRVDRESDPELFAVIDSMSAYDIAVWSIKNAGLVGDTFDKYDYIWADNEKDRVALWNDIRKSLGLEKKSFDPLNPEDVVL